MIRGHTNSYPPIVIPHVVHWFLSFLRANSSTTENTENIKVYYLARREMSLDKLFHCRYSIIERDDKIAKFWLDPIRLHNSGGFNRLELKQIRSIIEVNHQFFMEAWHEYFGH